MGPFDFIAKEWSELRKAPRAFVLLSVVWFGAGMAVQWWRDEGAMSEKDALLQAKDYQIECLEVALGAKAPSQGILVTLTNEELTAASTILAGKLRNLCFLHRDQNKEIREQNRDGKLNEEEALERLSKLRQSTSDEFDRTLRADTHLIDS